MRLLDSIRNFFCIGSDGVATGAHTTELDGNAAVRATVEQPATHLAKRTTATSVPDSPRAQQTTEEGWLSKIRSWVADLCCGVPRSKPVPCESVHQALKMARNEPERLGELTGKRIVGTYDLNRYSREEHDRTSDGRKGPHRLAVDKNAFTSLRNSGISLQHVKLVGDIRLPDCWIGGHNVALVKELAGSGEGGPNQSRPDTTGVRVHTTDSGISVENRDDLGSLTDAMSCNVKLGRIKLTGKVTTREVLDRVAEVVRRTRTGGGKLDLSELTVSLDLLFPTAERDNERIVWSDAHLQKALASLQLLKANGARIGELTTRHEIEVDPQTDPVPQLQSLLSLVDACHTLCGTPDRILEGLTLRAELPSLAVASQSLKPHDVMPVVKLLQGLHRDGAKLELHGSITFGPGKLDALHRISRLPGTSLSQVKVELEHQGASFTLSQTQARKLELLQERGATIDPKIQTKVRVGLGSTVL
jgi:hypothetical protein